MSPIPPELSLLEKFDFERPPVGVKFTLTRPEGIKKLDKIMDLCEMLVEAQEGHAFYVTREEFTCIGPLLLGMVAEEPVFESGRVGPQLGAFRDERANRRIYQYLPRLNRNSVKYVAFAPLDKINFEPDLLIIMATVTQAEVLMRAKAYSSGEMWTAKGTPVAACSWLYIYPLQTGEINFNVTGFGFGMRSRRLFPEGRILLTIPWDRLPGLMENLKEMEWVPESFTLGSAGHKAKVKRIAEEIKKEIEAKP
ncbi:MAG: DUF169 domain-containing protein [Chloroflexota bacterium]